jgi:hypothetical protein
MAKFSAVGSHNRTIGFWCSLLVSRVGLQLNAVENAKTQQGVFYTIFFFGQGRFYQINKDRFLNFTQIKILTSNTLYLHIG